MNTRPVIIIPVSPRDIESFPAAYSQAVKAGADLVEWRIDQLLMTPSARAVAMSALVAYRHRQVPILLTVRTKKEGGNFDTLDPRDYPDFISALTHELDPAIRALPPARPYASGPQSGQPLPSWVRPLLLDVQINNDPTGYLMSLAHQNGLGVVASFHDFAATPTAERLAEIFAEQAHAAADVLKVAVMPQTEADVQVLIAAGQAAAAAHQRPVIAISMSDIGQDSRLGDPLGGCAATFAALPGAASAPGQVAVTDVLAHY